MTQLLASPNTRTTQHTPQPARIGTKEWARGVLEDAYTMHGIHSDRFAETLYWYIALLFAHRSGGLWRVSVDDITEFKTINISKELPEHLQDAASDLFVLLYSGEDLSRDDGNRFLREVRKDLRRFEPPKRGKKKRKGMDRFRTNAQLIQDEAKEAARTKRKKSVFDLEKGASVSGFVYVKFDGFYEQMIHERKMFKDLTTQGVDDEYKEDATPQERRAAREVYETMEKFKLRRQDMAGAEDTEQKTKTSVPLDPLLIEKLHQFANSKEAAPLNAAIARRLLDLPLSGRLPNASAIAQEINQQNDVAHDKVYRNLKKAREEMAPFIEASKRAPAPEEEEKEPTRAAREHVISATVPKFLQKEFARTGPIKPEWVKEIGDEEKVWGWPNPMQRPGLCVNIITVALPEDTGTWYCSYDPSINGIDEMELEEEEVAA